MRSGSNTGLFVEKISSMIIRLLERLIGLLFIAIAGITMGQVLCRYVFRFSLTWSHELVVLLFIWTVWLCIPVGLDRQSHLCMDFLKNKVSPSMQPWFTRLYLTLSLLFMVLIFFLTFPVLKAFEGIFLATISLPVQVHYYANIVGSGLSIFLLISRFFRPVKQR